MKLAILMLNPVHYFVPLYRKLGQLDNIDMTIYYTSTLNVSEEKDPEFQRKVDWGNPDKLLSGYKSVFLKKLFKNKKHESFWGHTNLGIIPEMFKFKPDIIIIHGYAYFTSWLAIICAKLLGTKILFKGEVNELGTRSRIKALLRWPIVKLIFSLVDDFLSIGTLNRNYYLSYGVPESKTTMVPFTIDNEFFFNKHLSIKAKREEIRNRLGILPEQTVIVCVGKLIPRKRQSDLVEAIYMLNTKYDENFQAILVGDGPDYNSLTQLAARLEISSKITITGFVHQDDISEYYAASDIFTLCSSTETWGLVCNEAMCHELPLIVSSRVGCSPDLVKEGVNGYVYPVGDVNALVDRIMKLKTLLNTKPAPGMRSKEIIEHWGYEQSICGMTKSFQKIGYYTESGN